MTTLTRKESAWARIWNKFAQFAAVMDYDSTQYTYDRLAGIQEDLNAVKQRVEKLETRRDDVASECVEDAA